MDRQTEQMFNRLFDAMEQMELSLKKEISEVKAELKQDIHEVKDELEEVKQEQKRMNEKLDVVCRMVGEHEVCIQTLKSKKVI